MKCNRPIIVEGLVTLRLLEEVGHQPGFHIRLICDELEDFPITKQEWEKYNTQYKPCAGSSLIL